MKQRVRQMAASALCAAVLLGQLPVQAANESIKVTAEKGTENQIILTVAAENLTYNALQLTMGYDKTRLTPSDIATNAPLTADKDVAKMTTYDVPQYNALMQTGWADLRPVLNTAAGLVEYTISVAPGAKDSVKDGFVSAGGSQKLLRLSFCTTAGQTLYADSIHLAATTGSKTGIAISAKNDAYPGTAEKPEEKMRGITDAGIVSFDLSKVAQAGNTPGTGGSTGGGTGGVPSIEPPSPTQPPVTPTETVLTDISGHWAEESIRKLVGTGIVQGKPGGKFEPESSLTRAEFAVIAGRLYKLPAGTDSFTDTVNHWAAKEIAAAKQAGLLSGEGNGKFAPDRAISRQELATILARAEKLAGGKQEPKFADDASIEAWAKDGVYTLREKGLVKGYADGGFHPAQAVTRGEMATIVAQLAK